jgi:hypothetical protein
VGMVTGGDDGRHRRCTWPVHEARATTSPAGSARYGVFGIGRDLPVTGASLVPRMGGIGRWPADAASG